MPDIAKFTNELFSVDETSFTSKALGVFEFQAKNNPVYCDFLHYLDISPSSITEVSSIPFLPISLFKQHKILVSGVQTDFYFESSGTTQMETSKHFVPDESIYKKSFLNTFKLFYGDIQQYCIAALLPSYLERKNASLVYMCNELIQLSGNSDSGFFLNEWDKLIALIRKNESLSINTILIGVSFALVDLAAQLQMELKHTIIMETGGMKGKRKEITRSELHEMLRNSFGVKYINAEYGMTELLSQAYSKGDGIFYTPPWMKILIRDVEDPLSLIGVGKTGCINIIDLANIYSCSFIATQDLGKMHADGGFEVLGRFDNSDIRGCNLLIE